MLSKTRHSRKKTDLIPLRIGGGERNVAGWCTVKYSVGVRLDVGRVREPASGFSGTRKEGGWGRQRDRGLVGSTSCRNPWSCRSRSALNPNGRCCSRNAEACLPSFISLRVVVHETGPVTVDAHPIDTASWRPEPGLAQTCIRRVRKGGGAALSNFVAMARMTSPGRPFWLAGHVATGEKERKKGRGREVITPVTVSRVRPLGNKSVAQVWASDTNHTAAKKTWIHLPFRCTA